MEYDVGNLFRLIYNLYMYCPHCGKEIDSCAKFCPFCGKKIINLDNIYSEANELDNKIDIDKLIDSENKYLKDHPITDEEIENREDEIAIQHFKKRSKKYIILTIFSILFFLLSIKVKYPVSVIALELICSLNNLLTLVIGFGLIKVKHRKFVYRCTVLMGFVFFIFAALLYSIRK